MLDVIFFVIDINQEIIEFMVHTSLEFTTFPVKGDISPCSVIDRLLFQFSRSGSKSL